MRCFWIFLLIASTTATVSAKPSLSDDGWDVAQKQGYAGGGFSNTFTTTYAPADNQPPSADQAAAIIQSQLPGSTSEVAAQQSGLEAPPAPCDQSALTQLQAIQAQLQTLESEEEAAVRNEYACGFSDPGCTTAWANQALSYAQQAIVVGEKALALAPEVQAEAQCAGSGTLPTTAIPGSLPPGLNLADLAARFDVPWAAGGAGNLGDAYRQLLDASQGFQEASADFDGLGADFGQDVQGYAKAASEADAADAESAAGAAASQETPDYDDPDDAARIEALTINYQELGPKYASLANARAQDADDVADAAVAADQPVAFVDSAPPEMQVQTPSDDDEAGTSVSGIGGPALGAWLGNAGPTGTGFAGVLTINSAASNTVSSMLDGLPAAMEGSPAETQAYVDQLWTNLDQVGGIANQQTQNMYKSLVGQGVKTGIMTVLKNVLE